MAEPGKKALRGWRRLERVHAFVADRIESELKSAGLPPLVWLRALEELEHAGEDGLRPFELQRALDLEQPAVSRLLEKMAAAGAVARTDCAEDRRGWNMTLTASGREIRDRMASIHAAALSAHYLPHLSDKRARALDEILGEFLDSARAAKGDH